MHSLAMQSSQQSIVAFSKITISSFLRLNIWACWERYFSQEMGRSLGVSSALREDARGLMVELQNSQAGNGLLDPLPGP